MTRPLDTLSLEIDRLPAGIAESRAGVRWGHRQVGSLLFSRIVVLLVSACTVSACEPSVVVGQWTCPASSGDAGATATADDPVTIPWSTGFESRFCDYTQQGGYCKADGPPSSYATVSSPAHGNSGFAAAYTVTGKDVTAASQARCIRQGVLPTQAYYGAWYYIPATATNTHVWNLFHFLSTSSPGGIADVSLINDPAGQLRMVLHVFNNNLNQTAPVPIPIASWFHIEVFLKRAGDATGEVALYQDGTQVADFANIVTDDSNFGQWFVGNYADALTPPVSTVYVDDVTISATLPKP